MDRLNREPTIEELADESGISVDRINTINNRFSRPMMTMSSVDNAGMAPADRHKNLSSAESDLWSKYKIKSLGDKDTKIYGWLNEENPPSKAEIANRLGISAPAVSQRISKIENQLDYDGTF